eukprot:2754928-Prymnesium_polylepis.1
MRRVVRGRARESAGERGRARESVGERGRERESAGERAGPCEQRTSMRARQQTASKANRESPPRRSDAATSTGVRRAPTVKAALRSATAVRCWRSEWLHLQS